MPELPEVETIKRGLNKLIIGKTFKSVDFDWPKSFPNNKSEVAQFILGANIKDVLRRGKVIIIGMSSNYSLMIHLKMTGQLVYRGIGSSFGAGHPTDSLIGTLPDKSTRVTFTFKDETKLFFNDQRKFGWVKLIPTPLIREHPFIKKLGPEPLEKSFSLEVFKTQLKKRQNSVIKAALLDQSTFAGIGNIYADESLWLSKIHPTRKVSSLTSQEISRLRISIIEILKLSIKQGGSTDKNYLNAEGKKGSYLKFANVFRREGEPCPRCGTLVSKIRVAGRGTHVCAYCQKI